MIDLEERKLSSWKKSRNSSSRSLIWKVGSELTKNFRKRRKSNLKLLSKRSMMLKIDNSCYSRNIMRIPPSNLMCFELTTKMDMMFKRGSLRTKGRCRLRPWTMQLIDRGQDQDLRFLSSSTQSTRAAMSLERSLRCLSSHLEKSQMKE